MSERSREVSGMTMDLDVSDRSSLAVVLGPEGEVIEEIKVPTTEAGRHCLLSGRPARRLALEVGTRDNSLDSVSATRHQSPGVPGHPSEFQHLLRSLVPHPFRLAL
jgi:hypothetical protein